jgi:adenosylcobinamide-GDP ribazoletransferase
LVANLFGFLPYFALLVLLVVSYDDVQFMILYFVWMTLLPVIASCVWWRAKLLKRIGGYIGDTLGAMQQITELAFYLGLLTWSIKFQEYF